MTPNNNDTCRACKHMYSNHYTTIGKAGGCNMKSAHGLNHVAIGYVPTCRCDGFAITLNPPIEETWEDIQKRQSEEYGKEISRALDIDPERFGAWS